jgi:hypothetical protein
VPQSIFVVLVLLQAALEAFLGTSKISLLPVDMTKSIPCLVLAREQLNGFTQEVFGPLRVLWEII